MKPYFLTICLLLAALLMACEPEKETENEVKTETKTEKEPEKGKQEEEQEDEQNPNENEDDENDENDDGDENNEDEGEGDNEDDEGAIEVPFTDFSLFETSCKWKKSYQGKLYTSTVTIINSKEALESYIECVGESDYSEIDFSKHTLILAYGAEGYGVSPYCNSLHQTISGKYIMKVYLRPATAAVVTHWHVPIVVDKITEENIVKLIVI